MHFRITGHSEHRLEKKIKTETPLPLAWKNTKEAQMVTLSAPPKKRGDLTQREACFCFLFFFFNTFNPCDLC